MRRQRDESPTAANEEWVNSDHERIDPAFDKASEGRVDLVFGTGVSNMDVLVECAPRHHHVCRLFFGGAKLPLTIGAGVAALRYSITSSARAISIGGISMPSGFDNVGAIVFRAVDHDAVFARHRRPPGPPVFSACRASAVFWSRSPRAK
jgi:hypothetical protein